MNRRSESGLPAAPGPSPRSRAHLHARDARPGQRFALSPDGIIAAPAFWPGSGSSHGAEKRRQRNFAGLRGLHLRRLDDCRIEDLMDHYRRLSPDDCRLRFGAAVNDASLARLAERAAAGDFTAYGYMAADHVAALAQMYVSSQSRLAELAFSVEPEFRRMHLASGLLHELVAEAWKRSLDGVYFQFARSNAAMLGLARNAGANLAFTGEDVTARLRFAS